jgi:hypothetical protein
MAEIGAQGGKIGGPKRAKADGVPALRQAAAHGAGRRKRRKEGNLRSASLHTSEQRSGSKASVFPSSLLQPVIFEKRPS